MAALTGWPITHFTTVNGTWQPVNCCVIQQGGEHQVFLPTTNPMQFFRLVEFK